MFDHYVMKIENSHLLLFTKKKKLLFRSLLPNYPVVSPFYAMYISVFFSPVSTNHTFKNYTIFIIYAITYLLTEN